MSELIVELYGDPIGRLVGERDRFDFQTHPEALNRYGALSTVLSVSLPLSSHPNPRDLELRRNFFEEILAEGRIRAQLGRNARIDAENTMALLRRYGRDVAGAVQIWDPADPVEPREPMLSPISEQRVREMLAEVKTNPLGNHGRRRLSSLAGVQDKILLVRTEDGWAEPLDGYPSSHIIKPLASKRSLIFDEEYGSRFARGLGLADFETGIETFDGISALVVQRYDRDGEGRRTHQEDFNQVLGYRGDEKYESDDGDGRLRQIAAVLRAHASSRDMAKLLMMTTLSLALGNLDMHGKNISLLHSPEGEIELAPMYDVVPQLHLDLDLDTALFVNGKHDYFDITGADIVAEAESWRMRNPRRSIAETLERIVEIAGSEKQLPGADFALPETVTTQANRLLDSLGATVTPVAKTGDKKQEVFEPRTAGGGWGGPLR